MSRADSTYAIRPDKFVSTLAILVLTAVFYGDAYLRYVFPVAVVLLPVVWATKVCRQPGLAAQLPLPAILLVAMLCVPVAQALVLGHIPQRQDLALYLPLIYAAATMVAFAGAPLSDEVIWKGVLAGGVLTAAVMLIMMTPIVPRDFYLIPGQAPVAWTVPGDAPLSVEFDAQTAFYDLKNLSRNALGRSNYIAIFFLFVFTLALFTGRRAVALLFAILLGLTFSRFGLAALVLVIIFWRARRAGISSRAVTLACCLAVISGTAFLWFFGERITLPGVSSLAVRVQMVKESFAPLSAHWALGAPRSAIMAAFGVPLEWTPHSSIGIIVAHYGVLGLGLYGTYVALFFRCIYLAGRNSELWRGCYYAFLTLFLWSLVEIIVLTPAFEILLAFMFVAALTANKRKHPFLAPLVPVASGRRFLPACLNFIYDGFV